MFPASAPAPCSPPSSCSRSAIPPERGGPSPMFPTSWSTRATPTRSRRPATPAPEVGRRDLALKQIDAYPLTGQAYLSRFAPSRAIAEAMSKRWMEGAVPVLLTTVLGVLLLAATPVRLSDAGAVMNEVAERGLVAIGLTIVLVAGGIDLSVGSMVGVIAIGSLVAIRAWHV